MAGAKVEWLIIGRLWWLDSNVRLSNSYLPGIDLIRRFLYQLCLAGNLIYI